jgi:hypothetical protein
MSYKSNREGPKLPSARDDNGRPGMRRAVLALLIATLAVPQAFAAQFSIDAVKAAYLFRFASYVQWPEGAQGPGPFIIGVVGAEDVAVHLEHLLTGMSVAGKPARVRRVRTAAELDGVHILFIGAESFRSSRPLRLRAIEKPILLVTDSSNGLDGGGVINFMEVNQNLRFEISLEAADRCGLKIDSALLSVAARVDVRKK